MRQLFIGGRWREAASGETLPVVDPSTGETYRYDSARQGRRHRRGGRAARAALEGAWGR